MAPDDADRDLTLVCLRGTSAMKCGTGSFMEQSGPPSEDLLIPFIVPYARLKG